MTTEYDKARNLEPAFQIKDPPDAPIPAVTLSDVMDKLDRHSSALDLMSDALKHSNQMHHEERVIILSALDKLNMRLEQAIGPPVKEAEKLP